MTACRRLEKLVSPSIFWHKSFILDDMKFAELSNNSYEWKKCDIFKGRGSKHTLTPPTYFQWGQDPNPQGPLRTAGLANLIIRNKLIIPSPSAFRLPHLETAGNVSTVLFARACCGSWEILHLPNVAGTAEQADLFFAEAAWCRRSRR